MDLAPIACATDLRKSGDIAAAWAAFLAKAHGVPVKLLHAKGEPEPELETDVPPMMLDVAKVYNERIVEERVAVRHALARQAAAIDAEGVEVHPETIEGRAAEALLDYVARVPVSLVVVGPHTRLFDDAITERALLPLGTTAERLANASPVPVFIARRETPVPGRRLRLLFDLEYAEDAPELETQARAIAARLGAQFLVVDQEADLRALAEDTTATHVLATAATREGGGFVLASPATRRHRRYPFPVLALPRR